MDAALWVNPMDKGRDRNALDSILAKLPRQAFS
jgi:hypothetical protein